MAVAKRSKCPCYAARLMQSLSHSSYCSRSYAIQDVTTFLQFNTNPEVNLKRSLWSSITTTSNPKAVSPHRGHVKRNAKQLALVVDVRTVCKLLTGSRTKWPLIERGTLAVRFHVELKRFVTHWEWFSLLAEFTLELFINGPKLLSDQTARTWARFQSDRLTSWWRGSCESGWTRSQVTCTYLN